MKEDDQPDRRSGQASCALPRLGDLLRQKRQTAGLSQEVLARAIGISRPFLSRLEHGQHQKPDPAVLARIARVLNIPPEDLHALVGYTVPDNLPSLKLYLRAKHPDWPDHVVTSIEDYCQFLVRRYGLHGAHDDPLGVADGPAAKRTADEDQPGTPAQAPHPPRGDA